MTAQVQPANAPANAQVQPANAPANAQVQPANAPANAQVQPANAPANAQVQPAWWRVMDFTLRAAWCVVSETYMFPLRFRFRKRVIDEFEALLGELNTLEKERDALLAERNTLLAERDALAAKLAAVRKALK